MNTVRLLVRVVVLIRIRSSLAVLALALAPSVFASGEQMPLTAVRKGMTGYGLTVFEGARVEKFDVEILGVLRNVGPDRNLILARVDSELVGRAGIVAGMSGSPVFVDGKIVGALAYAWQFAKEPIAGITPIEEMLRIARVRPAGAPSEGLGARARAGVIVDALGGGRMETAFESIVSQPEGHAGQVTGGVRRIALPISLSSFSHDTIERFSPYLERMGFVTTASGTAETGDGISAGGFTPGDAIGAVLLTGDFNVAASGTVTWVDGDRVYAFGHPFLDMGEIEFPMATSEVVGVLPSLASSFKFSNTGPIVGVLRQDRSAGIMGVLGETPRMIPVDVSLTGSSHDRADYHVNLVRHSNLSPLMLAMVADSIVSSAQRAAGERTVILESEIRVKGFEPIRLREGWAGPQARQAIPQYLAIVTGYLMSNEFRSAEIESIRIALKHDDQLRIARLMEASMVMPGKGYISASDTVQVRAVLKPYRGEEFVETLSVVIPDDQPEGSAYIMVGSGTMANVIDFSLVPPDPHTLEQVLGVLSRLRSATDLTAGLYSTRGGAVTSGVYLPNLPPTVRAVVSGDTSHRPRVDVKYHPASTVTRKLDYVVDGSVKIGIDVRAGR